MRGQMFRWINRDIALWRFRRMIKNLDQYTLRERAARFRDVARYQKDPEMARGLMKDAMYLDKSADHLERWQRDKGEPIA